jgi:hypothetical protein
MGSYTVVYHGPSTEENPAKAREIAVKLASRSSFSAEEALERMARTPFVIGKRMDGEAALNHKRFLESLGARAEVLSEKTVPWRWQGGDGLVTREPIQRWYISSAWRGILSIMASGLLLSILIATAGLVLVFIAPLVVYGSVPSETLGVVGWSAIALGLFVLITAAVFRLPALVRLVSPPKQTSATDLILSYFRAINDRNWGKALRCLAGRSGSHDLGARPRAEAVAYLRSLAAKFVLPRRFESSDVTLVQEGSDAAVLRIRIEVLSRGPAADGSYQCRVFSEAKRFVLIDGRWFLLDGYLLGQSALVRLPLPGCPECGAESEPGRWKCPVCSATYPAATLIEEEWQPPRRRPDLAAILSALVPGLGQAYNGQLFKGILIAATCWTILPWIGGVLDALRTAERINRNDSIHDLPRRPAVPVVLHLALVVVAAALVATNLDKIPVVGSQFTSGSQKDADRSEPLFRAPGNRFTILFPYGWEVEEVPDSESSFAVNSFSEEKNASIKITGRPLPQHWQPCPQARAARERLEAEGSEVANLECGSAEGRFRYRVDSYSPDRSWRRSLIAIAVGDQLVVISFACPASRQDELVPVFERMIASMEFKPVVEPK